VTPDQWRAAYPAAAEALKRVVLPMCEAALDPDGPESLVQARVRMEASQKGFRLFRNNVGAGKLENGSFLRWGLCNDSIAVNKRMKSADLIGLRPIVITPAHVGQTIGQFTSIETKHPKWEFHGTDEENAQLRWAEFVIAFGGYAVFATGPGSF
jgi:hypothetical protein